MHDDRCGMLIQGSNTPITLIFSDDMSEIQNIEVSIWKGDCLMKRWGLSDVNIIRNEIELPLTERDTMHLRPGRAIIEAKWIPSVGDIEIAKRVTIEIDDRNDRRELINNADTDE